MWINLLPVFLIKWTVNGWSMFRQFSDMCKKLHNNEIYAHRIKCQRRSVQNNLEINILREYTYWKMPYFVFNNKQFPSLIFQKGTPKNKECAATVFV